MKESNFWFLITLILVGTATFALLFPDYLPTAPMFIEMTADFFGVFIALSLEQAIRNSREDSKAQWMKDKLLKELVSILKQLKRPGTYEMVVPTWSSIKPTDIPARIDSQIVDALSKVHIRFENYFYRVRQYNDHRFSIDPDERILRQHEHWVTEAKRDLIIVAEKALDIAGISAE